MTFSSDGGLESFDLGGRGVGKILFIEHWIDGLDPGREKGLDRISNIKRPLSQKPPFGSSISPILFVFIFPLGIGCQMIRRRKLGSGKAEEEGPAGAWVRRKSALVADRLG